jgi:CRISPR-associated Csx2 family protein
MARVFISVLGTSDYQDCFYCIGDETICQSVRFVQEALVNHVCKDWAADDRILIFTTEKSEEMNWLDDGHRDRTTGQVIPSEGLKTRLLALNLIPEVVSVRIPDGKDEAEVWRIFEILFDNLRFGDEIVFDITHAFRSIPMLVMTVLSYAKVTKGVSLSGIYYGNYEARDKESNHAPVFDLSVFDNLLDWTAAIDAFLSSGDASKAARLAKGKADTIARAKKGSDPLVKPLRKIASCLDEFTNTMSTCRGSAISDSVTKLRNAIHETNDIKVDPAFKPLLNHLESRLQTFTGSKIDDGIRAAEWCAQHNLVQQGFTILREFMIGYVCDGYGTDPEDYPARKRIEDCIGSDVHAWSDHKKNQRKKPEKPDTEPPLMMLKGKPELLDLFGRLYDYRNDINHAGIRKSPSDPKTLIEGLNQLIWQARTMVLKN